MERPASGLEAVDASHTGSSPADPDAPPTRPSLGAGRRWGRAGRVGRPLVAVALAVAVWELARLVGLISPRLVPSWFSIASAMIGELNGGPLWDALIATLKAWSAGLALGCATAIPMGIWIGLSRWSEAATRPVMEFMRPVPSVAFIPIAIIVLGSGFRMKALIIAFATFWPILFNTKAGVEGTDPMLLDTAASMGVERKRRILRVNLPSAIPSILTGIRISASIGLIVAITAEIIVGREGIGFYLESLRLTGDVVRVWGGVLLAGIVGYGLNTLLLGSQRLVVPWSSEYRHA